MKNLIVPATVPSTITTVKVEFSDYKSVEPEQLHSFTKEYENIRPSIEEDVRLNQGKIIEIPIGRVNSDGSFSSKIITGQVGEIGDKYFFLKTKKDLSNTYDEPVTILIRLDNTLGMIPLHSSQPDMNPLSVNVKEFRSYFKALTEMRKLLLECINTEHALTLHYRYSKTNMAFRKGGYKVEGEVMEVNKSNIVYKHLRTLVLLPGEDKYHYVNLLEKEEIDRFVAPDRYLQAVNINFGAKHKINFHHDDEES